MIPEEQAQLADALIEEFEIDSDEAVRRAGKMIDWLRDHNVELRCVF